ncbi:MAG: helix-turn-helix domain-containing protein [Desulfobacteraceae bacterium]|nr:helix-turn-helix domain-containing protein [Desulfobacteraceae bacterium]MBC2749432.1 helix-turn-helix domain-containing protein [Desulfobacteraceae bacterium]
MEPKDTLLTTKEFASRSGMTVAQVTKLLRENKIRGEKQSGRWMIPASALNTGDTPSPPAKAKKPAQTIRKSAAYSLSEFSAMTYLTEAGVVRWLKEGRLQGHQSPGGEWQIDAASLENSYVKNLLRP